MTIASWADSAESFEVPTDIVDDFEGLSVISVSEPGLEEVDGPLPGMVGVRGKDVSVRLGLAGEVDVSTRGSLSFWLRIDRAYHSAIDPDFERFDVPLVEGPLTIDLQFRPEMFQMFLGWDRTWRRLRVQQPAIDGPAWYHVAYDWDTERGTANGYINGTPIHVHNRWPVWKIRPVENLHINLDRFAVAKVRLSGGRIDPEQLRRRVTALYRGTNDLRMGACQDARYVIERNRGDILYENPLGGSDHVEDWALEGPGEIDFDSGWMRMVSADPGDPDRRAHFVHWCPETTPDNYIVEWKFQRENPREDNNLAIFFFSARGYNGRSIFDPGLAERDGRSFGHYTRGDIDAYHISYYVHSRFSVNLRKNHGFYMPAVGPHVIPRGSTDIHKIEVMKNGGHIQLAVDGKVAIDFYDDGRTYGPVLGGGKVGFRQMVGMEACYRDLRIYGIDPRHEEHVEYGHMPR